MNPDMIVLARESRGLTQTELAPRLGMTQAQLSKIENGIMPPPPGLSDKLAAALDYPPSFFAREARVYGPGASEFFHRKRQSVGVRVLDQIHAHMNIVRFHVEDMVRSANLPDCTIPRHDIEEFGGDAAEAARVVRAELHLPKGPIKNLVDVIEGAGGIVVLADFPTTQVDAVSWWVPGLPAMFYLNRAAPPDRLRMTLAHELGHMVLHQTTTPSMEEEANIFASEFLMPAADIAHQLDEYLSLRKAGDLKLYWRTSMASIIRKAHDLGKIGDGKYRWLNIQMARAGYKMREPPEYDPPREQSATIAELFAVHREELGYSLAQLAAVLSINEMELARMYRLSHTTGERRDRLRVIS